MATALSLPRLAADLLLLHAPAFFEFRERRDIYFPFLGTSGDVPITPLYEYFPLGFKTLERFLSKRGFDVKIINLSTVFLRYPKIEFNVLVKAFDVRLIGISLHWMVHVQGGLAIAELIKKFLSKGQVIFGGISATYYANELISYPFVDMVMRGYDTHEPMARLLGAIKNGSELGGIPNLLWKSKDGQIHDNNFSYKPNAYRCGIDWSTIPQKIATKGLPILEVMSTQNVGCAYNCGWCGGSHDAFRRIYKRRNTIVYRPLSEIAYEFQTLKGVQDIDQYHFYSVGSYNECKMGMKFFLKQVAESGFKSINYEQFYLTPDEVLRSMAEANKRTTITLSPQSHNIRISKLGGRGTQKGSGLWNLPN
jgi:clorobiocin biosynthesis protein CloN6